MDQASGAGLLDAPPEMEAGASGADGRLEETFDLSGSKADAAFVSAQVFGPDVGDSEGDAPQLASAQAAAVLAAPQFVSVGSSADARGRSVVDGDGGSAALSLVGAIVTVDLSGDVYWRQTEAIVSDGDAIEITGVVGNVIFEGLADLIGLGGSAVEIEAAGSVNVLATAAFAGDESAISAQSSGAGDVVVAFSGAATAGDAEGALSSSLARLEAQLEAVEAALAEAIEEAQPADEAPPASPLEVADVAEIELAPDEESESASEEGEAASSERGGSFYGSERGEARGRCDSDDDREEADFHEAPREALAAVEQEPSAEQAALSAVSDAGRSYLTELSEAVDEAVETVVDSFVFAPEFVDGAMGQLANASAVGLLAHTGSGGVSVFADGVVMASGDAIALSSDGGRVFADIDGVLMGGETAFTAQGDRVDVDVDIDGSAFGGETAIDITAIADADVNLNGDAYSGEGSAVRISSMEGDVDLYVRGDVRSGAGVGVEIEAADDVRVHVDGSIQGGLAVCGAVDATRIEAGARVEIDIHGELIGGRAVECGSAAAVSVDESFGADVRLTVVGDAWVEAGFVGLERDAAIRLGAGDDIVEIEGRVIGDLVLGDGDDVVRLDDDGVVEGAIIGGRGDDVFYAGDLSDLFEMTFGAGFDTVYDFGFGDCFDFSALAEYNDNGAAAMLEISHWDHGEDVVTLGYFDGVDHVELTVYGDDLHKMDFDDVFIWV